MTLYPKADTRDPRWGAQNPAKTVVDGDVHRIADPGEDGAVPAFAPLDSEAAAASRMLAAMEADLPPHSVRNRGLAGSDDVSTVAGIFDEIEAERRAWNAVRPADHSTETKFEAALVGKHLDATTWYNALKAKHDVSTYAELVSVTAPAVEML